MATTRIESAFQLLVEGNDARNFFEKFVEHLDLAGIQVQNFGGVDELKRFLKGFVRSPGFKRVERMGIVRDAERRLDKGTPAEKKPSAASSANPFQSVQSSLRAAGLPAPNRPGEETGTAPAVSVFILPGGADDGMLETLLCRTFAGTEMDRCVDGFLQCAEESGSPIHRRDKSRAHAWLATRQDPHVSVGVAAQKGYWNFNHEAFDGVREFLRALGAGAACGIGTGAPPRLASCGACCRLAPPAVFCSDLRGRRVPLRARGCRG